MATVAQPPLTTSASSDDRFFLRSAIVITVIVIAGFSFHLAMGRSTFSAPLRVHLHAVLFMGWSGIFLLQSLSATTGRTALHRALGWIAVIWLIPLFISGFVVTAAMVQGGFVPFFFRPVQFLIFDPFTVVAFTGLTIVAVLLRRKTEWHRRLHFCGMALLLAPPFGRLLPLPLLQPLAWEACFALCLLFPVIGAWADHRRSGKVHPAWKYGIATMVLTFVLIEAITYSPLGLSIYDWVTQGTTGEQIPPLDFATPPADGAFRTGRD